MVGAWLGVFSWLTWVGNTTKVYLIFFLFFCFFASSRLRSREVGPGKVVTTSSTYGTFQNSAALRALKVHAMVMHEDNPFLYSI